MTKKYRCVSIDKFDAWYDLKDFLTDPETILIQSNERMKVASFAEKWIYQAHLDDDLASSINFMKQKGLNFYKAEFEEIQ